MAPTNKISLACVLLLHFGSEYRKLSLIGLAILPLVRANEINPSTLENASCEGETCNWEEVDNQRYLKWRSSDHLECNLSALDLDPAKVNQIDSILNTSTLKSEDLIKNASLTDFNISAHLVFRYLNSVEFADKYHGERVEDAIVNTVNWRNQFGISTQDLTTFSHLVDNGLGYTSSRLDKHGRSIIYLKVGRNKKLESQDVYRNLLMYTVERADRMSVSSGSGQFIAVVDLAGFTWSTCPSISMIKDTIGLLKKHYPYRLGGIFILNGGTAFNFIWNLLKPIMPKRALLKTFVLNKKEEYLVLNEHLGSNNFEVMYGGKVVGEPSDDVAKYFQEGFWFSNSFNTEVAAN